MAQETEVVVFEVDVSSYEKSLADLTKSINGLKDTQADLQKQTKDGAKGAAESLEKVNAQLKLQQQEYRTTQNILVGYTGAQQKNVNVMDFSKNSIQANRDLLKQLTAQYINTTKPTQDFTNKIKDLSDKLKEQEAAIGNTNRNVGNYGQGFSKVTGALTDLFPAMQGFKTAQLGINTAMEANPIGLVVVALQTLGGALQFLDPIMDKIEQATFAFNAGFGALINGGNVFEAANQAAELKKQLQDLEDAQLGVSISTAQYDSVISRLLLQLRNKNLTEEKSKEILTELNKLDNERTEDALKNAKELLASTEKNFLAKTNLEQFELNAIIESGKVRKKLTEEEIEDLAKQAKISKEEVLILDEKFRAKQAIIAADVRSRTKINQEDLKKELEDITAQRLGIIQIEQDSSLLGEKIANRQTQVEDRFNKERETKAAKAKAKKEKADSDAERLAQQEIARLNKVADTNERLEQLRIETLEKGLQKEEDLYKLAFEKKIPDLIAAGLTEQQIVEAQQDGLNKIREKYAVKAVEIEEGKFVKIAEAQDKANVEANEKALKAQQNTGAAITQAVIQTVNAISGILSAVSSLIQQTAQQNIQSLQEQAGDGAAEQKRVAIESRAIKLKAFKEAKAINLTMAIMNTANAVMAQISNPTPYVGFVLAALAAATGAIQIATIAKQKPPSFALGGKVVSIGGKSHADGGTPIHVGGQHVAEAEAGEGLFVMKKDAYNDIQMLSGWNQRYGGRSFTGSKTRHAADGGEIQIPSDGGFSTRSIRSATDNAMQVEMAIMNGFKKAPAPELSIVELNSKQTSRNRSVDVVSL